MAMRRADKAAGTQPVWEIAAIACLLNEDSVFIRPGHQAAFADLVRDHFTLLNVWHAFQHQLSACSGKLKAERNHHVSSWCTQKYLNHADLRSAQATLISVWRWFTRKLKFEAHPAPEHVQDSPRYVEVIKKILYKTDLIQTAAKDPSDHTGQR
ncbi:DEAH-box ATP-dependent RNA helicase prp43 [Diaporthe australafricana]|uniref:DEAH-box ATP-dependent RNA helicase prp43 n=1 Tax=Diaporthe australafricana TaxID=127596 RepID=A0ABR3XAQ9_9PEZI